jgi:signal transduction histidine kinase
VPPIPADAAGLNRAFLNLLNNAMDAVENGSGVITVASKYESMHRNLIVRVIDNGSGIPPDDVPQIFTPFYSSKGHRGTGLGLAVAKKVVEEHHGKIEVASEPGSGSTFTVTLPALPPPATDVDMDKTIS